ncbi:Bug family tripartite tricarboxylate transporter substrate binding protein [Ramlibacter sp.]|uniref:Bug family tripartite tricarboxylate transporter substrate binding protein n=1 Tax=Ramlibacter sp. TaxID=1917967 RepID=UPI003D10B1B9
MHTLSRRRFTAGSLALLAAPWSHHARAQAFPSKPIRFIIGFTASGAADVMCRTVAQHLGTRLGQSIAVENRLGASGIIAADAVAKSPPDGYTLLFGLPGPMVILPALGQKLPYDPIKDFAPVGPAGNLPLVLVVPSGLPAQNLKELIALAKAQPGKLNYASTGPGSTTHLGMELLKHAAGLDIRQVPYKGQAAALPDLLAGNVQMLLAGWSTAIPHVKSGKLRYIAVTGDQRSAAQPQVPTMAELGIPGIDPSLWCGLWAPAGTPADIVTKLSTELAAVTQSAPVRERFAELGMDPMTADAQQFARFVQSEQTRWVRVIKETNLKME